MRLIFSIFVLLLAISTQSATRYVDFSGGNDANAGTSTAAPWKRAPGMKSVSGVAAAFTPAAGDRIVFKGGVTIPISCFQWAIAVSGSSGNPITYAADPAWYAGGSFTRPLLDFQSTLVGPGWTLAAGVLVTGSYVTFDNLELANFIAPLEQNGVSLWGSTAICINNANNFTLTNSIIRDWRQVGGAIPAKTGGGGAIMRVNNGAGHVVTHSEFHCANVTYKTGTAVWNIGEASFCTFHDLTAAFHYGQLFHDNHVYNMIDPSDPDLHSNVLLCPGGVTVYNNLIHDIQPRAQIIFTAPGFYGVGQDLIYNNVVYNVAQPCVAIDTDGANNQSSISRVFNNTLIGSAGTGYAIRVIYRKNGPFPNLQATNNHYITSGNAYNMDNPAGGGAIVTVFNAGNNLQRSLSQANADGYMVGNAFAPIDATKPTFNAGATLAQFSTDINGVARPQAGVWDIGAYEFTTTTGVPGTLVMAAPSVSVAEDGGSVTLTIKRTGGSTGAVGVNYATANGDATAGVNYTAVSGTKSWANGDAADQSVIVPILSVPFVGSKSFTFTLSSPTGGAAIGIPASEMVTINGVGTPPTVVLPGLAWTNASTLSLPFVTNAAGYYSQPSETTLANGGRAIYYFTNAPGTYTFYSEVATFTTDGSDNSVWVAVNATPTDPGNIFDVVTPTGGVRAERAISQRGTGTYDAPSTNALQVFLDGGVTNRIEVWGREGGMRIYRIEARLNAAPPPVDPPMILSVTLTNYDGYYSTNNVMGFNVSWSTNATVTGVPFVLLNSGGTAHYSSGSGTSVLTFTNLVQTGENSQSLDTVDANSLVLDGATIKFGAVDADLTLPTPGEPNSASFGRSVVVDTIAPVVTIGAASQTLSYAGQTVSYALTFSDTNLGGNTLVDSNVTLNGTTTGTISTGPNSPQNSAAVTISALTVGTGSISIAAGVAYDLAGNLSAAAGPSAGFTITSAFGGTANVISTSAGVVISNP